MARGRPCLHEAQTATGSGPGAVATDASWPAHQPWGWGRLHPEPTLPLGELLRPFWAGSSRKVTSSLAEDQLAGLTSAPLFSVH